MPRKDRTADAIRMAGMLAQGMTLQRIGDHFGLTRERVRQLVTKLGAEDSRRAFLRAIKADEAQNKAAAFEARIRAKWAVSVDVWRQCRADGVVRMFEQQRKHAAMRGIEWGLTFGQWLAIWQASGKLDQRGRGKGRYCMSRIKDTGGYVLGNVHIQTTVENSREAVAKWTGKVKANRGVFMLYPGTLAPWCARYGRTGIGRYATEEEAVKARDEWMRANASTIKRATPYRTASGKYQGYCGRTYLGLFNTVEEVNEAKRAHLARASEAAA